MPWLYLVLNIVAYIQALGVLGVLYSLKRYRKLDRLDGEQKKRLEDIRVTEASVVRLPTTVNAVVD